ncbi:MAG: hypothetical protein MH321_09600 [Leptospiraceae bacterium]|nr:hypothetical protein [Leptospiraceae bacterium]
MKGHFLFLYRISLFLSFYVLLTSCTNFSASRSRTAPPIIISISSTVTGIYTLQVRAQNPEILFSGYRLYAGGSVNESRNPPDVNIGFDCLRGAAQPIIPNQPIEYTFEIHPDGGAASSGSACRFQASLSPGTFVTIRSLLFGINLTSSSGSFSISGPSNTFVLPNPSP